MADDHGSHACCSGDVSSFAERAPGTARMAAGPVGRSDHLPEEVELPGGIFAMGDSSGDANRGDGELPVRQVEVEPFAIDATSVTNDAFAAFVDATGYVTDAEDPGVSAVFHLAVRARDEDVLGAVPGTPWWLAVRGADWRHPAGPESAGGGRMDLPPPRAAARRPGRRAGHDQGRAEHRALRAPRGRQLPRIAGEHRFDYASAASFHARNVSP